LSDKREIKAIFIDAVKEEVREITLKKGGDFKEMYRILTLPWNQTLVDDINVVRVSPPGEREPHYLYVDGEGLLKDPALPMTRGGRLPSTLAFLSRPSGG
jgi:hypothetical protein